MNLILLNDTLSPPPSLDSSGIDGGGATTINNNCFSVITDVNQVAHIKAVLKVTIGDSIKVGQLGGKIGTAIVSKIAENEVYLENVLLEQDPPAKLNLTIILALPRPKVLRRLIMDMTALGVARIILVNSYKTEKSYWQSPMLKRIDEFVKEGLQQGVDTVAPVIELKKRFKPFVEDDLPAMITAQTNSLIPSNTFSGLIAHPYADTSWSDFSNSLLVNKAMLPSILCIGGEGGWIDYEVELLSKNNCLPVSLGPRILRTESAINVVAGQWLMNNNLN